MADNNTKQGNEDAEDSEGKEGKNEEKKQESSEPSKPSKPSQPSVKVGKKLEGIIKDIEELSVLELSELVKALEEKFGVTAAVPMAAATAGSAPAAGGEEAASEQTTFNVILTDSGANKISVIKAVREIVPTLGLKETKDLVDAPPKEILTGVNKENAQEAKTKLETAGAKVELK
ncbi:MAG: 50S ribosomal protein L7/L12 [Candidatus Curtissbacteria bacterium GW2011_GWA2_41_24]|uniref:Large ribosomal subunit protein bL12 n=1 Tax=Candidatus Curtissbacteria bacterium GW2011_GWA2_41_24 TaxID=1618411 RepID=A0A0G0VWP6_9BACT|nr:MAG: 50S ribosomal protein L7/L12 [Candidatus Curtissbacteria bacterium GW2011_GWA2_41_24]